ncbi:ATP-binding protein [Nesterenkonia haasae]|uniref:ATP-binding protein n=1 Tax=Nesterenkonia haasae TaxID=2587813 RepID=UPI00139161B2|nr:hypothetical protein [Nesterenkonia haasae]NDK30732.1 hypothetical protein [Nesterenkonia haasae]
MDADGTLEDPPIHSFLRDGFEVHAAALERDLAVTVLPRQVLLVGSGNPVLGDASFVHGVPQSSTVAGVTFAQDKRVRRALLEKQGFSVPRGATFSIGKSARQAVEFAERIGFPVVVKPTMGDNTIGVIPSVSDAEQMREAIEYLHTPLDIREDFTRASYAMTELREPGLRDGVPVAPSSYRFLVEREVSGQYVRVLVVDGTVRSALYCPSGPWKPESGFQDITEVIDPSIASTAVKAAKVIPGLALAAVDMIVPNFRENTPSKDTVVVELSERPWLEAQWKLDPSLAAQLACQILSFELRGVPLGPTRSKITVQVRFDGAVAPAAFRDAYERQAARLDLKTELEVSDPALGHITGQVTGPPRLIAWLTETALDDGVEGHKAMVGEFHPL